MDAPREVFEAEEVPPAGGAAQAPRSAAARAAAYAVVVAKYKAVFAYHVEKLCRHDEIRAAEARGFNLCVQTLRRR
jgi:hypothetical protein